MAKTLEVYYYGDEIRARDLDHLASLQLGYLKESMSFQNLQQDRRFTLLIDGRQIECTSSFGRDVINIYAPYLPRASVSSPYVELNPGPITFVLVILKDEELFDVGVTFDENNSCKMYILNVNERPIDSKSYDTFNFGNIRCVISGREFYTSSETIDESGSVIDLSSKGEVSNDVDRHEHQYVKIAQDGTLRCLFTWGLNLELKDYILDGETEELEVQREITYTCKPNPDFDTNTVQRAILGKQTWNDGFIPEDSVSFFNELSFEECVVWFGETVLDGFRSEQNTRWSRQVYDLTKDSTTPIETTNDFPYLTENSTVEILSVGASGKKNKLFHLFEYDLNVDTERTDNTDYDEDIDPGDPTYYWNCKRTNYYYYSIIDCYQKLNNVLFPNVSSATPVESSLKYLEEENISEVIFNEVAIPGGGTVKIDGDFSNYQFSYRRSDQGIYEHNFYSGTICNIEEMAYLEAYGLDYYPVSNPGRGEPVDEFNISAHDMTESGTITDPGSASIRGDYDYDFLNELIDKDIYLIHDVVGYRNWSDHSTMPSYITIQSEFRVFGQDAIIDTGEDGFYRVCELGVGVDDGVDFRYIWKQKEDCPEIQNTSITVLDPVIGALQFENGDIDTFYKLDNRSFNGSNDSDNGILFLYKEKESVNYEVIFNKLDVTAKVASTLADKGFSINNITRAYMV